MKDYCLHECSTASIQLPAAYRISKPLPRLISKRGKEVIGVDLLVDDFLLRSQKQSFDEQLPPNPDCNLSIVRKGHIDIPYQGYERIVQTQVYIDHKQLLGSFMGTPLDCSPRSRRRLAKHIKSARPNRLAINKISCEVTTRKTSRHRDDAG